MYVPIAGMLTFGCELKLARVDHWNTVVRDLARKRQVIVVVMSTSLLGMSQVLVNSMSDIIRPEQLAAVAHDCLSRALPLVDLIVATGPTRRL
jgi:hypothetical protein